MLQFCFNTVSIIMSYDSSVYNVTGYCLNDWGLIPGSDGP
jgi:hypothetical protein